MQNYAGWFIAIDADSGEYFLDADHKLAKQKALAKYPDGMISTLQLVEKGVGSQVWSNKIQESVVRIQNF